MERRNFLTAMAGASLASSCSLNQSRVARRGRIKQAVSPGVFRGMDLEVEQMVREAARLGAVGFDHLGSEAFPVLEEYGLVPTMVPGGCRIEYGINRVENHAEIGRQMRQSIRDCSAVGAPNIIVLTGLRGGMSDEEGADNCVQFFDGIKAMAEDLGVTLCLELLNSRRDHPGYMADHTAWGVAVCERVNSPRVKLLYDIYHMQVMEGDIIRTIRDNIDYIAHIHTAGNPGRHQADDNQELNYVGICRAILETGFEGYVAHEYTTDTNHLKRLDQMMTLCDV